MADDFRATAYEPVNRLLEQLLAEVQVVQGE
jgi:hypothetical protein